MSAETITSRIHEKADRDLLSSIKKAVDTFTKTLSDIGVSEWSDVKSVTCCNQETTQQFAPTAKYLLGEIADMAFAVQHQRNRTDAVDAYMNQVEALSTQIAELERRVEEVRS